MTTAAVPAPRLGATLNRLRWAVLDALTLTERNLTAWLHNPMFLLFTLMQPVMFTLLFRYVLGGAIPVHVPGGYVDYLLPGVIGQAVAFGSSGTAIALGRETQRGVLDRFRSMPMVQSAVLAGRMAADTVRMFLMIVCMIGIGYAVGFRFHNGLGPAIAMVALATVFGLALSCVSAFLGLSIKDVESIQAFGLIWVFPFTFVSSAFVPIQTMPGWLQAFAYNQPVTIVVDTLRYLALGPAAGSSLEPHLWQSFAWLGGMVTVFGTLAVRGYLRRN
ncbi:MAG TPA: ABC transporter permease [Streptosporangiaceae bacterium]